MPSLVGSEMCIRDSPGPLPPVLEEMNRDGGLRRCHCDRRSRQGEAAEEGDGDAAREPLVDDEDDGVPLLEELVDARHRPGLVRQEAEPTRLGMISYAVFCLKKKKLLRRDRTLV